ncbi:MAG: hypothetical protein K0B05_05495 [Bacteroidales bacterium]|nr:hypothetical protein [Bacteroidales bacterium]
MKKLIAIIVGISLFSAALSAQSSCKVLLPALAGSYNGECKKGLADGRGEATGMDQYNGEFKKGFPDGVGTYLWQTGEIYTGEWKKGLRHGKGELSFKYLDRDSVLSGVWKDDKYMGERLLQPYVIEYRNSIGRVSCIKVGDRPYVRYKFSRGGEESDSRTSENIRDLLMQGSSGSEKAGTGFTGFEQVTFPFQGKLTFKAPNALMTATLNCELRFTINEPGSWVVTIYY